VANEGDEFPLLNRQINTLQGNILTAIGQGKYLIDLVRCD
jgi:hypothetical protein